MKAAYLLIDAASLAFPLAFARSIRFGFGRAWPRALLAVGLSALPFAAWDIAFARAGVWDFNPAYVLGPAFLGLPIEEWLFFLCIPFACLFIYRQFAGAPAASGPAGLPSGIRPRPGRAFVLGFAALSLAFAALSLSHAGRAYTLCVGLCAAAAAAALAWARPRYARPFLLGLAVQYLPFLLVNGLLTALPVVLYRADAILGPRLFRIPVEDAAYAFAMFASAVAWYETLAVRAGAGTGTRAGWRPA